MAVAQDMGVIVDYLPGLAMRRIAQLQPGETKRDPSGADPLGEDPRGDLNYGLQMQAPNTAAPQIMDRVWGAR